jgi:hypothetical protein
MINTRDISFVIQGVLSKEITPKTITNIRKYFPKAEIVLSTYTGTDTYGLDCDKIELVEDPGFFPSYDHLSCLTKNNVNRQIKTTLAGLKAATRKYVFKIRTDFIISGRKFLSYFDKFPKYDIDYKVFNHKILSCVFFARNPRTKSEFPPYLFHPSDIAFFGLREDLLNLFDIPFMTKEEALAFKMNGYNHNLYVPEQHIWVNCLRKNGYKINFDHQRDASGKNFEDTERYAVSNFIYLDWKQFNLIPPKHLVFSANNKELQFDDVITHIEWQRLYKQYIDNSFVVPKRDDLRELISREISVWFLNKENNTKNRSSKMKKFIKKLLRLFRRILHGDVIRALNDNAVSISNANNEIKHILNNDIMRILNEDVVRVLNDNVMRVLNDDVIREINHMKTEIQYMKSVFAKREHLFDMAADIKNHISILHNNNEKTRN